MIIMVANKKQHTTVKSSELHLPKKAVYIYIYVYILFSEETNWG